MTRLNELYKQCTEEKQRGINPASLNLIMDDAVTCKQIVDFYDTFHEDKEFFRLNI